ncbi:hypothetical protein BO70DRAFT_334717 [Aspergillus heteromorphus CBS 117.55]|uniref:Uncharacterized protein n=1 Tax=Aspergillus heteromorphus CBS 117.55 TaxID=1448321 RepID=A0A317WGL9_9EURO|nr:uncharacterized protein BO70DRAFT_334717 [Aspergillus heteromorphus CBS 117.55]PWY84811.1 hypothetical protein BO70DRAFT_334717 [Aspergillus heteromorphus CBS 117.55]
MEPVTESRNRYNLRRALTLMERDIKALEETDTHVLDQAVLKRCRVRALPLSLDADDSLTAKYFTSFAPENMPAPTPGYVDREYNTDGLTLSSERGRLIYLYLQSYVRKLMMDFPEVQRTWSSNQIGDYNFGNLYRTLEPEFGTLSIIHVANSHKPHIKCIMHNDLDVDDGHLLYGEIMTVIRIMLGQLKQKVFVNHMIAPVLLFSMNRWHPRAIEAYFDGQELLIRRTKPYDFTFLNAAGLTTFAQWFLGDPIGDTSRGAVRT